MRRVLWKVKSLWEREGHLKRNTMRRREYMCFWLLDSANANIVQFDNIMRKTIISGFKSKLWCFQTQWTAMFRKILTIIVKYFHFALTKNKHCIFDCFLIFGFCKNPRQNCSCFCFYYWELFWRGRLRSKSRKASTERWKFFINPPCQDSLPVIPFLKKIRVLWWRK